MPRTPRLLHLLTFSTVTCLACQRGAATDAVKPLAPRPRQDGEMIEVTSLSAKVLDADSLYPKCPVRPHAEAGLAVQDVAGAIQYRWERSDGTRGPLMQVAASKDSTMRPLPVQADEWRDTLRGVQLSLTDQLHITYPFDVVSAPIAINAKCY